MSRKDEWNAEMKLYENIYRSITKRKTRLIEILPKEGGLGYTSSDGTIHIARRHQIMAGLKEDLKQFFRMGVFAHEMCHQIFTDFAYLEEVLKEHSWPAEMEVIRTFSNIVEDTSIEYWAETEFGGDLLAALRYSIAHIYRKSPELQESTDPFTQLLNALIQFGDMGMLKGHFTSKEAFEYFRQIAPEYNEAVINPDPRARIDAAIRWSELTKPLWYTDSVKEEEDLLNQLQQLQDDNAVSNTNGSGNPPKTPQNSPQGDEKKENRKKEMLKKLESSEENDEDNMNADDSDEQSETDCQSTSSSQSGNDGEKDEEEGSSGNSDSAEEDDDLQEREDDKSNRSEHGSTEDQESKKNEKADDDQEPSDDENSAKPDSGSKKDDQNSNKNGDEDIQNQSNKDSSDRSEQTGSDSDSEEPGGEPPSWSDPLSDLETNDGGKDLEKEEVKGLDQDVLDKIRATIERSADGIANRRKRDEINFNEKSRYYGNVKCLNEVMKVEKANRNAYQSDYASVLKKRGRDISLLTSSLHKIFQQDSGETCRSLSGKYNVVRASKQSTAKIFDRKRSPKNLEDLAVFLLIDESGSMGYGRKATMAKETAIMLAESFANLQIPCYIMGFTTGKGYDALHHHYVSWKNTKEERLSLSGIGASASNFDGYSIRNAAMILKKKQAEHKILFVISDGYPASDKYKSMSDGVADTTAAIQEAKAFCTVLGIGVGDCRPDVLKHMYKGSFVHAETADELSTTLTRNLRKILRTF